MAANNRVCLAYSGILAFFDSELWELVFMFTGSVQWVKEEGSEVVCFLTNVGQEKGW
jgi:argininosuccinate synthase